MRRLGGARLAALLLAAVLGVSSGAITGFASLDDGYLDPLNLGIPLDNVGCTDGAKTLIVVGWGNGYNALASSAADWRDAKYLETDKSCATAYPRTAGETATYAVYLPAFDSPRAACEEGMDSRHNGNFVTVMRAGNQDGVPCACVMDVATLPVIGEGQKRTMESGMWIRLYQQMLERAGYDLGDALPGLFDIPTIEATRVLQTDAPVEPTGIVDSDTWGVLRNKACDRYEYS